MIEPLLPFDSVKWSNNDKPGSPASTAPTVTPQVATDRGHSPPVKLVPDRLVSRILLQLDRHLNWQPTWQNNAGDGEGEDNDPYGGSKVLEAEPEQKEKLKRPQMYKVIFLNDDYTPMEFVVHVLQKFFGMDLEKATQIMLAVHTQGAAVAGIFPRDIAETKSEQVNLYSQENNHPLMTTVEMTD